MSYQGNILLPMWCNNVIVNVIVSCQVKRGFDPLLGQTKGYAICMHYFSAKHATVMN